MAAPEEVAEVRLNTDENTVNSEWDDPKISALIDELGVNGASATIWRQKAAKYAKLVDVSEAGSSRAMGNLHRNALEMAKQYGSVTSETAEASGRVKIWSIEREYRD